MQQTLCKYLPFFALCVSASGSSVSLPGDRPVPTGTETRWICGTCCQSGSFCGQTEAATYFEEQPIPENTDMTCVLRDRSVPGAVDGGLCVPNVEWITSDSVQDFCLDYLKV